MRSASRGSGGIPHWEEFEKLVHFGDFWRIFLQFISCSESDISKQANS